jgi:nicotinate phosphoribosyltransferase
MGVVEDSPALDSVYKLVEFEGRPVAKLSTGKATLPGRKQVWRRSGLDDRIGLRDQTHPEGEPLLEEVMRGGRPTDERGLADARRRFDADLAALPPSFRALEGDEEPRPERTEELNRLAEEIQRELTARELGAT